MLIGLLAHPRGGRQSIEVVQRMTLHEVVSWNELFGDVSQAMNEGAGDG